MEIDGFVLAGGLSSRMGRDKSRLELNDGHTLAEHAAAALRSVSGRICVVGKHNAGSQESVAGPELVPDIELPNVPNASMIGLVTALSNAKTAWAAIIACDLPFVSDELFPFLAGVRSTECDAVVPLQPDGRPQPLCALYRCAPALDLALGMIGSGQLALHRLLERIRTVFVPFSQFEQLKGSSHFFLNLNTPEEYILARSVSE